MSNPEDFTYDNNDDGTITITGLKQDVIATGSLVIPGEIDGKTVTAIGNSAFYSCLNFRGSLTIPDSVTTIGNDAFDSCEGIGEKLTIGKNFSKIAGDTSHVFLNCYGISVIEIKGSDAKVLITDFYRPVCFEDISGNEYWVGFFPAPGTYYAKVTPESISLNKTSLDVFAGTSVSLNATVSPDNAYNKVTWSSSDESVATVDSNGEVTFKGPGKADITA